MSVPDRREALDRGRTDLSIRRRCELLGIARSGVYRPIKSRERQRSPPDATRWRVVHGVAFLGSRRMAHMLSEGGARVNRKRVQRLMRRLGIARSGRSRARRSPLPAIKIYPYLLRNLTIERPNHVWAADITYLPIGRGFFISSPS